MLSTRRLLELVESLSNRRPEQRALAERLVAMTRAGIDVLSRQEYRGHVTTNAIVLDDHGRVLQVLHRRLGRWLTPGGHLEPALDHDFWRAARRELLEETGIDPRRLWIATDTIDTPIDLDRHTIPASPKRSEPEHDHWDLRFLFRYDGPPGSAQADEVAGLRWAETADVEPAIREAVARFLAVGAVSATPPAEPAVL